LSDGATIGVIAMCKRIRLAGNGLFTIDLCECGAVHLTIGFTTLRLAPSAYRELAYLLDQGLLKLPPGDDLTLH
jgi:hypothetical protein